MTDVTPEPAHRVVAESPGEHVCPNCLNTGFACETHPGHPWEGATGPHPDACDHGPGIPCPTCCDPIPQDGTRSIADAFTPRHPRGH
jgi:hypothetical protein